jgi:prephenate dehydrogenase
MNAPTVAIVGVGLIGGSLGMAWRRTGAANVIGVFRREESVAEALAVGAIDRGTTILADAAAEADVLVLCTPVRQIVPIGLQAAQYMKPGAIITDAGSTKSDICQRFWAELPTGITFIGGHPMAGSEQVGVLAADPYLFENAVYCLTPPSSMADEAPPLRQALRLVEATGARSLVLTPQMHDLIVAAVSHVPHLVAAALVNTVAAQDGGEGTTLSLAAGGFRDTTRIASGSEMVWRDICLTNRSAILQVLQQLQVELQCFGQVIADAEETNLERMLAQARQVRASIPAQKRGLISTVHELTVMLVDEPGAIHRVTGLLAQAGLNILDIEILRVREGEGGTLRLALPSEEAVATALRILQAADYSCRKR